MFSEVQLLPATLKSFRRGYPTGPGTTFRLLGVPVRVSTQVPVTLGASVVPTIDNLLDAQGSLLAANASLDTAAWFMHPDTLTRLRGRWWQCPNRCNQSAAYQRTGHLPVTDRVDRATTRGGFPSPRVVAGTKLGAAHSQGDRQPGWLPRAFAPYGTSPARRSATGCQPLLQRTAARQAGRRWRPAGRPLPSRGRCRFRA